MSGDDTVEAQRESEALQRVVAKTSKLVLLDILDSASRNSLIAFSNMVDIFEITPAETSTRTSANAFAYTGQGARVARYQHLISKLDSEDNLASPAGVKVDWMEDDDTTDTPGGNDSAVSRPQNDEGPLVGTFADAAAAMR